MAQDELNARENYDVAAEGGREPSAEERDAMRRFEEEIGRLTVADHLELMLHSLSSMVIDRLGMGEGGAARRDLDQARTAIDGFRAILGVIEGGLDAERLGVHRAALSQMQMAYVAISKPAPAPEASPAAEADVDAEAGSGADA